MSPTQTVKTGKRFVALDGSEPTAEELAELAALENASTIAHDTFKQTELGNAERLIARHGENLRYLSKFGWFVWAGNRWVHDDDELAITALMFNTIRELYEVAAAMQTDRNETTQAVGKALHVFAAKSESNAKIRSAIELAKSLPGVVVKREDFDACPHSLNVQNGTLDLRTGQLRPHARADYMTRICPVAYKPKAKAPMWQKALRRWQPNEEVRGYLARVAGYSLTALTGEETAFLYLGKGRNGKSKFTGALEGILGASGAGGYAARVSVSVLMDSRRNGGVTPDLVDLVGARLVIGSEIEEGRRLNEAFVKDVTGGDPITVNPKNKAVFRFVPKFKLHLYGNHAPDIRGTDDGIWARLPRIDFGVTIPASERDPDFAEKLVAEYEGVLAWAVEGAKEWYKSRLSAPQSVLDASSDYRTEQDPFAGFFDTVCMVDAARNDDRRDGFWFTSSADIRAAYKTFVGETDDRRIPTTQAFGERLGQAGGISKPRRVNNQMVRGWLGVRLVDNERGDDDGFQMTEPAPTAFKSEPVVVAEPQKGDLIQCNSETDVSISPRTRQISYTPGIDSSVSLLHCNTSVCSIDNVDKKEERNKEDEAFLADMAAQGVGDPFADMETDTPAALVWAREPAGGGFSWVLTGLGVVGVGKTQAEAIAAANEGLRLFGDPEPDLVRLLDAETTRLDAEGEPTDPAAWLTSREREVERGA